MNTSYDAGSIVNLAASVREQANALILKLLAGYGVHDLLPSHGAVMRALFERSPCQMGELADMTGRKKNTVTSLVSTLEERGYCRREASTQDARVQLVFLTEKGESLRQIQENVSKEIVLRAWCGIDARDKDCCVDTLAKVLENLKV